MRRVIKLTLNGKTTVSDNGVLSYQWYKSDAVGNFNEQLPDKTARHLARYEQRGNLLLYVIANNTKADATGKTQCHKLRGNYQC